MNKITKLSHFGRGLKKKLIFWIFFLIQNYHLSFLYIDMQMALVYIIIIKSTNNNNKFTLLFIIIIIIIIIITNT